MIVELKDAQQLNILEVHNQWAIAVQEATTNYDGKKLCAVFVDNAALTSGEAVVYAEIWPACYFSAEQVIGSRIGPIVMEKGRKHLSVCLADLTNDVA